MKKKGEKKEREEKTYRAYSNALEVVYEYQTFQWYLC